MVSIACSLATLLRLRLEVVRIIRQDLGPVVRHEHDVLEPNAPIARAVEPGLDGDDVAGDEGLLRDAPHARRLVHLEADAVAERVEEAVLERLAWRLRALRGLARRFEDVAGDVEE